MADVFDFWYDAVSRVFVFTLRHEPVCPGLEPPPQLCLALPMSGAPPEPPASFDKLAVAMMGERVGNCAEFSEYHLLVCENTDFRIEKTKARAALQFYHAISMQGAAAATLSS